MTFHGTRTFIISNNICSASSLEPAITSIVDNYLRNRMVDEFKILVEAQCKIYPNQKDKMVKQQNYLLNHLEICN